MSYAPTTTTQNSSDCETLKAMCRQEATGSYTKRDFLHQDVPVTSLSRNALHIGIDVECRDKMCEWSYQIVDFCSFSRESVEIAMSYLDRFLLTRIGSAVLEDRNIYQLASMTALYTAIKIHERQALNPKVVSQLSRGAYTVEQIEEMETVILTALDWRMNPPTSVSFVREFMTIIPHDVVPAGAREIVLELAKAQTELAVSSYSLMATPASMIAYCALVNALDSSGLVPEQVVRQLGAVLGKSIGICYLSSDVTAIQNALYPACRSASIQQSKATEDQGQNLTNNRPASFEESPRSVSNNCLV